MTTFTLQGFVLDEVGGGFNAITQSTFEVVVTDGTSGIFYDLDVNGFAEFDETNVMDSRILVNGVEVAPDDDNTDDAVIALSWDDGGTTRTAYLLNFFDNTNEQSYVFQVGGFPLPDFFDNGSPAANLQDFEAFFGGATVIDPVNDGQGFDPGSVLPFAGNPLVSSSEDDLVNGTDETDFFQTGIGNDTIFGNGGNDFLYPGDGNDSVDGGADFDAVSYRFDTGPNGVTVDLENQTATDRNGGIDTLVSIEAAQGSSGNDTLIGAVGGSNFFEGYEGDDSITGGFDGFNHVWYLNEDGGSGIIANLLNQTATDSYGNTDTLFLIDQVTGTDFADSITGDNSDFNVLAGEDGNDTLIGLAGDDDLFGGDGEDSLDGGDGSDFLDGGAGNDYINPGTDSGNFDFDFVNGSSGNDTIDLRDLVSNYVEVNYGGLGGPITANLDIDDDTVTIDKGPDGIDTILGAANALLNADGLRIVGTGAGDTFNVDYGDDTEFSLALRPGRGIDSYFLEAGTTNVSLEFTFDENFNFATSGTNVNLATGQIFDDGFGFSETISGPGQISHLRATNLDDTIIGGDAGETFRTYGGNDDIDGGDGFDWVRYDDTESVVVDLGAGTAIGSIDFDGNGAVAFSHSLSNIEAARGSRNGDDSMTGSSEDNQFRGRGGDDTLVGLGGQDRLRGEDGADSLVGGDGEDELEGGDGNDTLLGEGDDDTLWGGAGADSIDGGAGDRDRVDYRRDAENGGTAGVTVDLSVGTATDGFGDTDAIEGIEQVTGTQFADTLIGDDGDNDLVGKAGDDSLVGGAGNEYLEGGAGNDTIDGGAGDRDFVSYRGEDGPNGVTVNLSAGTATDTFGDTDTLISIEEVDGTNSGDDILGNGAANFIDGRGGADLLIGFGGDDYIKPGSGQDNIDGGADFDTLAYDDNEATTGIVVTFTSEGAGSLIDWNGDTDSFSGIERIRGTGEGDTIDGAAGRQSFSGEGGHDVLSGFDGDDDLAGNSGNDTLNGGAGNDFLQPGDGTDSIDGGDDFDVISYEYDENIGPNGVTAVFTAPGEGTVVDWNGNTDTFENVEGIYGTANADSFTGSDEEGEFAGGAGNDIFIGGASNRDQVRYDRDGQFGATQGVNVNLVSGVATDAFNDQDSLSGIERISGTDLDDTMIGDDADNEFYGADGDDELSGGVGSDYFQGGQGNDTIDGGDDTIDGFDFVSYYWSIRNAIENGDSLSTGITVTFSSDGDATVSEDGFGTQDTLTGIEGLEGSEFADVLTGGAGRQFFRGLAGDDIIDGGAGDDDWASYGRTSNKGGTQGIIINFVTDTFIDTYGDSDTLTNIENISGSDFGDVITGNDGVARELNGHGGNDTITGGDQDDTISGGDGDDSLLGGAGHDEMDHGSGNDHVDGGAGDDTFLGGGGIDTFIGGSGTDTYIDDLPAFDIAPQSFTMLFNLSNGQRGTTSQAVSERDSISGIENYTLIGDFDSLVIGDGANNVFVTDLGADTIIGGAGNDSITSGAGDDEIDGSAGVDTIFGGSGNDTIAGGVGFDLLLGQNDDDELDGGSANDTLLGGNGNDVLNGGSESDELNGGAGADTQDGGEGADIIVVDALDTVTDTGTSGFDRAQILDAAGVALDLSDWSGVERVNGAGGGDTIDASSYGSALFVSAEGGNDLVTGTSGNDTLLGGDGNDTLEGGAGNDLMLGGAGDDEFSGGDGDDSFYIGQSGDVVTDAGEGFDKIIIDNAAGVSLSLGGSANLERVSGFTGNDTLDATGNSDGIVMFGGSGNDNLIGGSGNDILVGQNDDDQMIGAMGNDSFVGGNGDDTFEGGAGDDLVIAGAGADVFVFTDGFGRDTVADYDDTADVFDFTGHTAVNGFGDLTVIQAGANTRIEVSGSPSEAIVLISTNSAVIDASDFDFV